MAGRDLILRIGLDGRKVSGQLNGLRSRIKRSFSDLGGLAGFGGVAGLGAAVKQAKEFNDRLVRLQVNTGKSRGEMMRFNEALQKVSVARGIDQDALLGGAAKFQELTGNFDGFAKSLDQFAVIGVATGASMDDIASSAAALSLNLGVSSDEMLQVFDVMATQGKQGAVELNNFAGLLSSLTPQFAKFNTTGAEGAASLGAFMQIIKEGEGTAEEAATSFASLMTAISKNWKKFEGEGVQIFSDKEKTKMRDLADIVFDIGEKIPQREFGEFFGRQEAVKAMTMLLSNGREAFDEMATSVGKTGTIMKDFQTVSESASGKFAQAQALLKKTFSDALIKHVDSFVKAFEAIVASVKFLVDNKEAMLAAFAVFKGGGMLAGAGAGMSTLAASGSLPTGQSAAALRRGRIMGGVGGVAQGAAVGLVAARVLGKDLGLMGKGVITASHALAGMPGPLGALGMAVSALTDVMLIGIGLLNKEIDDRQKAIIDGTFGEFAWKRSTEFHKSNLTLGRLEAKKKSGATLTPEEEEEMARAGKVRDAAALHVLGKAAEGGALKIGPGGKPALDQSRFRELLASDKSIEPGQREALTRQAKGAAGMLAGDEELQRMLRSSSPAFRQMVIVEVKAGPGIQAAVQNDPKRRRAP